MNFSSNKFTIINYERKVRKISFEKYNLWHSVEFRLQRSVYGIFTYQLQKVYGATTRGHFTLRKRCRIRSLSDSLLKITLNYPYTLSHRII
jgi:hypothetical protein